MIGIIEYGAGNVKAIERIYKNLNIPTKIISKESDFKNITKIILPGVGAYDKVMSKLMESGLLIELNNQVLLKKTPILGICVGMQIMGKSSEEGKLKGLNWINGVVKKFDIKKINHKPHLPHMGWNSINNVNNSSLFDGVDNEFGFYFVHSYYFEPDEKENILSTTEYSEEFVSGIFKENIYGTQFHPEKSHSNGITLLKNFYNLQ